MRGSVVRGVLAAAVMAGLVAGCSGGGDGKASGSKTPGAGKSDGSGKSDDQKNGDADAGGEKSTPPAKAGGSVGAAGSACKLPVTFKTAAQWKAEEIDIAPDDEFAELAVQGPVIARCEIDAKPAGNIGFIRVYVEEPVTADADPLDVLKKYVAADEEPADDMYRAFTSGDVKGMQVEYESTSRLLEETKTERAFAVRTPEGIVVVALGGMDTQEHEAMLPAYELAKQTLKVN
ncbi:lipoprotein [Streptomyces sp. N35]|uniref:lipoprotein n=1 Tax=Streptomyces sp. N35 TaxID=2795730 RepID=UPI0018F4F758|nr:lipoprotein [Streptomyces sp. N35]